MSERETDQDMNDIYHDDLVRLGKELETAFDTHLKPVMDRIWELTDRIESDREADGTTNDHLTAVVKYMAALEKSVGWVIKKTFRPK